MRLLGEKVPTEEEALGCDKHFPLESMEKLFRGISFSLWVRKRAFSGLQIFGYSPRKVFVLPKKQKNIGLEFARFRPILLRLSPVECEV